MTTCGAAIKNLEAKTGEVAAEAKIVKLYCQVPPIAKMDGSNNDAMGMDEIEGFVTANPPNLVKAASPQQLRAVGTRSRQPASFF